MVDQVRETHVGRVDGNADLLGGFAHEGGSVADSRFSPCPEGRPAMTRGWAARVSAGKAPPVPRSRELPGSPASARIPSDSDR